MSHFCVTFLSIFICSLLFGPRDATISNHLDPSHLDANFCCSQLHSHMSEIAKWGPYHTPWSPIWIWSIRDTSKLALKSTWPTRDWQFHTHPVGLAAVHPNFKLAACATVQTKVWRSISGFYRWRMFDADNIQRITYKYLTHISKTKKGVSLSMWSYEDSSGPFLVTISGKNTEMKCLNTQFKHMSCVLQSWQFWIRFYTN